MRVGAIFDWDGVIIDSGSQHERSWEALAREENLELPVGHFKKGFGMKNEMIIPNLLRWTNDRNEIQRMSLRKEEIYRGIMAESDMSPLPGVVNFLKLLHKQGIPCAIGSSSPRLNIETAMERMEISHFFKSLVCAEEVIAGKPDPAVFLLAAERIDCNPRDCVVFEDAPAGIAAAHNGGMRAVAIATSHLPYELTDADIVVHSLDELTGLHLGDLFFLRSEHSQQLPPAL